MHANQYFIFLLSIIDLLAKCQMTRQMKVIINLSKNMERGMNRTMKEFSNLHQSGKTGKIFFAKSKSIGRQKQLGIGEKKYLRNLYIVCLTYEI